ncbi:MAG: hypothetical protein F4190_04880 [Acidimicrobiales bacterium]|nr:hypothetical protein [Acidimicrobiales bacterium]MXY04000.1 hypothetical protein [Acidimicrobiales bacterium]MXZ16178.1 hypothetical protein [Acidimicrobiales bacterium]MYD32877.1 hypothetical protein [Acidimicrobiales bacterium]MYG61517.1 hypothetical protein [Acidimicrobiales bacterium]
MSKRLAAALLASLTFAAVLAVVPLASPAAAHEQTTTKQYCAYDPFAGQQCWNETVSVAHHHPPANQTCPAGTTGTPPNCLPIPPTNDPAPGTDTGDGNDPDPDPDPEPNPDPDPDPNPEPDPEEDGSGSGTGTDNGGSGSDSGSDQGGGSGTGTGTGTGNGGGSGTGTGTGTTDKKCPEGKTGTPPNCTDLQTATYPVKPCTPVQEPLEIARRHRHPLGDSTADGNCHRHDDSHCPAKQIEIGGHGSQNCQKTDAVDNIITRIQHLIKQGTTTSLDAAREAIEKVLMNLGEDGLRSAEMNQHLGQELLQLYRDLPAPARIAGTYLFCVGLAAAAVKAAPVTGGTSAAWFVTHAAGLGCTLGIEHYIPKFFGDEGDGSGSADAQDENGDSGTGSTPSTPAEWDKAVDEAEQKWRRNEIDGDELHRLQNLRDCAYNRPWATNCP